MSVLSHAARQWHTSSWTRSPTNACTQVCGWNSSAAMLASKKLASVALEVKWGIHCTQATKHARLWGDPLRLWNPEETSPIVQNRGFSGPQKNYLCPPKIEIPLYPIMLVWLVLYKSQIREFINLLVSFKIRTNLLTNYFFLTSRESKILTYLWTSNQIV